MHSFACSAMWERRTQTMWRNVQFSRCYLEVKSNLALCWHGFVWCMAQMILTSGSICQFCCSMIHSFPWHSKLLPVLVSRSQPQTFLTTEPMAFADMKPTRTKGSKIRANGLYVRKQPTLCLASVHFIYFPSLFIWHQICFISQLYNQTMLQFCSHVSGSLSPSISHFQLSAVGNCWLFMWTTCIMFLMINFRNPLPSNPPIGPSLTCSPSCLHHRFKFCWRLLISSWNWICNNFGLLEIFLCEIKQANAKFIENNIWVTDSDQNKWTTCLKMTLDKQAVQKRQQIGGPHMTIPHCQKILTFVTSRFWERHLEGRSEKSLGNNKPDIYENACYYFNNRSTFSRPLKMGAATCIINYINEGHRAH